ncbi:adenylate/guanylate cyclase domain-containing protein [Parasedimentitalea psychrophila]|uniref:Adenylate/guanylate cyclase domain-containing protein n=1 Tax=Parasedimentitalea psychrophila TaxID=2997337 RepID=A0A9Y2KYT1_9RHOB|nr:adenylate/guanylate cyclase domain-containing protein [Parasedimentitalea psychrophila]WIY24790.1 adenylate/guanylate cyclase domain-containing protein [Parasedimentitalea psychrophila]
MRVVGAALIADVSNSTPLYERVGAQVAFSRIRLRVEELRVQVCKAQGVFVHSKGDDILAFFQNADAAVKVAEIAIARQSEGALKVHAGVSWGNMLLLPSDLYGVPVNIASRLASLAKPHEVLVYGTCFKQLSRPVRETLREVDVLRLKGSTDGKVVYSHVAEDPSGRTANFISRPGKTIKSTDISLKHKTHVKWLTEGGELTFGRASDCDLVVSAPWVSRRHATISVVNGIVEFRDHSTLGSYLRMAQSTETVLRRTSVTLTGTGLISLGAPILQSTEAIIEFSLAGSE